MNIINRDEVMQRQADQDKEEIEAAVSKVNKALVAANSFPTHISAGLLGGNPRVRMRVAGLLQSAGWQVKFGSDQWDGDYYTVQ